MYMTPTYSAIEIRNMAMKLNDAEGMLSLANLINEEMELYTEEDLPILTSASMIIIIRSLIIGSIKLLPL